jgi:hypothetical protein
MFLDLPFPLHARQIMHQWFIKRNNPIHYSVHPWVRKIKGLDFGRNLLLVLRYLVHLSALQPSQVTVQAINQALAKLYPQQSYVGDKHPDYWFRLDTLVDHRDLSCVVIFRDPRDMVSSVLKKSRGEWKADWAPELCDAACIAQRWLQLIETVTRHQGRLHFLSYEALVMNPQRIVTRLGSFLGLEPHGFKYSQVTPTSIGKFKQGLTAEELEIVLKITGATMRELGYEI